MALPKFLQPYLASYDLTKLDKKDPAVAKEVITQVLNEGDPKALRWVFENYTLEQIRDCVRNPQKGVWFEKSINYWQDILKVQTPVSDYKKAILNLYPY